MIYSGPLFVQISFKVHGIWNVCRHLVSALVWFLLLKKLYEGEERKQAIKRHLEFYNTQPFVTAPIIGVVAAMEEQKANGKDIQDGVINGIKVGMMGPSCRCW